MTKSEKRKELGSWPVRGFNWVTSLITELVFSSLGGPRYIVWGNASIPWCENFELMMVRVRQAVILFNPRSKAMNRAALLSLGSSIAGKRCCKSLVFLQGSSTAQVREEKRFQILPRAVAPLSTGTRVDSVRHARTAVIEDIPSEINQSIHPKAVVTDEVSQSVHQPVNSPSIHQKSTTKGYLTPGQKAARERQLLKKARRQEHYFSLVFAAAYVTAVMLSKHGLSCAVFGSLACKLYGPFRYPEVRWNVLSSQKHYHLSNHFEIGC